MVGRDAEVAQVEALLTEHARRLVVLVGPGGVGKTSLALAAASELLQSHPGGVWLVRADQLRAAGDIVPTLAGALRVRDRPGTDLLTAIGERLEGSPALLVLDNLEHLEGAAAIVEELLTKVRSARVLATSRSPLRIAAEHVVGLGPLAPDDALALFESLGRAADAAAPFEQASERAAAAAVCRALDGLPLAIELAAARLQVLTPVQLARRLGSPLELTGHGSDRPARHRSLRATVEWSLELLAPEPRRLFQRLAVFTGPVPFDLIEEVCGDGIDVVEATARLLDFSLLRREQHGLGLIPALRELAAERLTGSSEEAALRRAHALVLASVSERIGPVAAASAADRELLAALLSESFAAAEWSRAEDAVLYRRLVVGYAVEWTFLAGRLRDALVAVERAMADGSADHDVGLLLCRAHLLALAGRLDEAARLAKRARPLLGRGSPAQQSDDLLTVSLVLGPAGDVPASIEAGRESLSLARTAGDAGRVVRALGMLAQALMTAGELDAAEPLLDEAETLARGMDTILAEALPNLRGDWALESGDATRALDGYWRSLKATLGRGDVGLALYDVAGVVVALDALGETLAAAEAAALLEAAAAEQAIDLDVLRQFGTSVRTVAAHAQTLLSTDELAAITTAARDVPAAGRFSRVLAFAEQVRARPAAP